MREFQKFEPVFRFFVRSSIDNEYVQTIDSTLNDNNTLLVESIQKFHKMRQQLCRAILNHMGISKVFELMTRARGVRQYNLVPDNSICIFSKKKLKEADGILIVIDNTTPFTFDKRYKNMVFHFWYVIHLPEEMITNVQTWMQQQRWWLNGSMTYNDAVEKCCQYKEQLFAKQAYIKLTSVCKYIQTEMADIPIN